MISVYCIAKNIMYISFFHKLASQRREMRAGSLYVRQLLLILAKQEILAHFVDESFQLAPYWYTLWRSWNWAYKLQLIPCSITFLNYIGRFRAAPGRVPPGVQILSFSCSFLQKNWKIIALLGVGAPLRKILDPPLLNQLSQGHGCS